MRNLASLSAPVSNLASLRFRRNSQYLLTKMNPGSLRVLCIPFVTNKYVNAKIFQYVEEDIMLYYGLNKYSYI